jgi:hypothetical protein
MGEWRFSSTILDLGIGWRYVVCFIAEERAPGTHWIGSWVGPRTSPVAVE